MAFALVFIFLVVSFESAFGDWYILIPKRLPPRKPSQETEMPRVFKKNVLNAKPYKVELKKLKAPNFSIMTPFGKVSKEEFAGRKLVLVFVKDIYSPISEQILFYVEKAVKENENAVALAVDVNDANFVLTKKFSKEMKLEKTIITANSFLFKQFKSRLPELKTPSVVLIDSHGFIKYVAVSLEKRVSGKFKNELAKAIKNLL
jgi:hypothetical protein